MKEIVVFSREEFRKWLEDNHDKEEKVCAVLHKKHTGKTSPSHRDMIEEAICFGWIDTTVKRLDEDRYLRHFSKRNQKSRWSDNTLSYAERLLREGKMAPVGMKFYELGKQRPTHDSGIPKNPGMPLELKKALALAKNKKAKNGFERLSPSRKRAIYRWFLRAKLPETRLKRLGLILKNAEDGESVF